ncbi:UBX domain-containing protein 1 [Dioscorea alata]|uniref:UBX domain-containing protein 1 n=1 Tax=Dioscorea alata TaxID=55571 RepID=A0ACB7UIK2_DIOAL|nr:UBX domain-containing protein 1 [Dioscorea alata]
METRGISAEEETLVDSFCAITSSSRDEARFFLESHNWALDQAIHSFYEDQQDPGDPLGTDEEDYLAAVAAEAQPPHQNPLPVPSAPIATMSGSSKDKKPSGSRPGIRTLADLNRQSGPGSDSDSDGPQEYYTGGEKSGMLVQDPTKGGNHDVNSIFDQARQMGATQGPFEQHPSSSSRSFTGTGRLLTGETVPSVPPPPENILHNIYFWTNGFSVNDGPLRRFDDPENAAFLESIKRSDCPKELEPADRRSSVHVNLIRREENYPEPVRRQTPFQGVGRTLGGGSSTDSAPASAAPTTTPSSASPPVGLSVDESLPSTSIQLRLADGTRMIARFNTHHTISDIRAFIDASRPGATRTYQLQTVDFPPKQLTDMTQTIEQAGLANSVVIQKR